MTEYTSNPTANDELTQMIIEDRYARTLANIARRAENLWDDGYAVKQAMRGMFVKTYEVTSPAGERYTVKIGAVADHPVFGDSCTCPSWKKYGNCKHRLAVSWMLSDEAQAEAFDKMMASAEGSMGCDPDARF